MSAPTHLHLAAAPAPRRVPNVVVIGAGLGGLAVALRLQGAGLDVTVLEQRATPGGRASRLRTDGYTWDTGPSLITMPWVLEEAFAAGGLDLHAEVRMRRLEPLYRIRWAGEERAFDFHADREALRAQVARFDERDAARLPGFLDALRPIYEEGILGAGRRAFGDLRSFAGLLPRMARLGAILPLHRFVARHFRHPRVREAFSFHSLFIGGDPFRVPAIYGALAYLQVLDGGWYADGGVYSLVEAMARPLDLRCGAHVESIERGRDGVRAVWLEGGERVPADVVISNADVLRTQALLGDRRPRRRLKPTMSCFLLYLGTDRIQPSLLHHTLLVGDGYREFIRTATRGRGLPRTFSTYVHAPARTEPAMAPAGGDSLAILLPVPNLRANVAWDRAVDGLRDALVADLERTFGLDGLGASVAVEHRMAPPDFAREFGAVDGNAFAVEPTLHQSAYLRAPNRVAPGLYHVGAGTHPGAGIPGVLLGAEVTAGLVAADVRR
jgi:phytoene desaturase